MSISVFISSTSRDLLKHRAAVSQALLNAGYHPIDMANFMARPEGATSACLKEVAEADIFVGIYAWRYGYIPANAKASITEQEYIEAERLGKPCFCFMVDEAHPWPEEFKEQGSPARLLVDFKARLDAKLVRTTFTDPEDLAMKVLASLQRWEREQFKKEAVEPVREIKGSTMSEEQPKQQTSIGGINFSGISGSSISVGDISTRITAGGDIVAGDKIEIGQSQAESSTQATLLAALKQWQQEIETKITTLAELEPEEKEELKEKAVQVRKEAAKGAEANPGRLERLLNSMSSMAPDILEVTARTLQNPFAGVGLVLQKINDRVKIEQAKREA